MRCILPDNWWQLVYAVRKMLGIPDCHGPDSPVLDMSLGSPERGAETALPWDMYCASESSS